MTKTSETKEAAKESTLLDKVVVLSDRVHNLEQLIARMAHNSGVSNRILIEHSIEPYQIKKSDIGKYNQR